MGRRPCPSNVRCCCCCMARFQNLLCPAELAGGITNNLGPRGHRSRGRKRISTSTLLLLGDAPPPASPTLLLTPALPACLARWCGKTGSSLMAVWRPLRYSSYAMDPSGDSIHAPWASSDTAQ
eukprot:scaffold2063_cov401-Prasinococcus_capsulatus_cf.AAC.14